MLIVLSLRLLKYDALTYHLELPRHVCQMTHAFVFEPQNPYWGHPQLVELSIFTLAFSCYQALRVQQLLLSWAAGCISPDLVFQGCATTWIKKSSPQLKTREVCRGGLHAVSLMVSGSTFRYMFSWSYTDLFSASVWFLCTLLSFAHFLDFGEIKNTFISIWSFCRVLRLGTKWTAALVLLPHDTLDGS